MSEEKKTLCASTIHDWFNSGTISTPITSSDLLLKLVAHTPPVGLPQSSRFRLTDLSCLESILEKLSVSWTYGTIEIQKNGSEFTVASISVHSAGETSLAELAPSRKRKRVIDEDADSAAEEDDATDQSVEETAQLPPSSLASLSKELKEVYAILQRSTAKGRLLAEQYHSTDDRFEAICPHITKDDCARARQSDFSGSSSSDLKSICNMIHFRALIRPHTDTSLGHCSYLNTCYSEPTYAQSPSLPPFSGPPNNRGPASLPSGLGAGGRGKEKAPCRYLHYEVDWDDGDGFNEIKPKDISGKPVHKLGIGTGPDGKDMQVLPPQWINCDVRRFDYSVLGKFHVIMADPPWDIHMSLPYGTMTDDEMRAMPIPALQDEGFLFLWVTGRAMEVGRECLRVWGYTRVDEVVWVKTNQLQRVIRTGRTGHWLNHTKEHMLVGVKTHTDPSTGALIFPSWANRGLDTDVIVSEVRETSRKPDEAYGMIERMCPGGRKIEIFGRRHNTRPGWLTLGNQLGPDQIHEEDLAARINAKYPERGMDQMQT